MASVVIVTNTGSVVAVALAASALDVLVTRVVLQMKVSAGGGATSDRGLLLECSSLVGGARL